MLTQIEREIQNGLIVKNGVSPVTTSFLFFLLFFLKILFQFKNHL